MQLQQDCAVLEGNVTALRRLLSEKKGAHHDMHSAAEANPPSSRDSALIAHLEIRAKQSEQRAESMMFQKNEAQSRFAWLLRPVFVNPFALTPCVPFSGANWRSFRWIIFSGCVILAFPYFAPTPAIQTTGHICLIENCSFKISALRPKPQFPSTATIMCRKRASCLLTPPAVGLSRTSTLLRQQIIPTLNHRPLPFWTKFTGSGCSYPCSIRESSTLMQRV